ncbi:hypothetical protein PAXRUDRAFT_704206 [Paxillus rubicundulus Ve08.2h10]|uniref:Uncharacterized protein n=1 Tax=Paxillus rubicundulus Ve08.2h10 TaxID=930991 RepID=A0A0D0DT03_9AGAM|nr:hypothetical protein PAXRUDRAFT_704206 [Paxillus rubicundulus Ve08.2h10]
MNLNLRHEAPALEFHPRPLRGTSGPTPGTAFASATPSTPVLSPMLSRPYPTSSQLPIPRQSIPEEHLGIAYLSNTELTYDRRHVPNPPAIHFSQDIDRPCREWESLTLLTVNGHGIPHQALGPVLQEDERHKGLRVAGNHSGRG